MTFICCLSKTHRDKVALRGRAARKPPFEGWFRGWAIAPAVSSLAAFALMLADSAFIAFPSV